MACPFFHPVERFEDGIWVRPPRLPLGDPCRGDCRADPSTPAVPTGDELRHHCNLGYGRGRCPRFPDQPDTPDAVRFSVESDGGGTITLIWILEKDYEPFRHGRLVYDVAGAGFDGEPQFPNVLDQARLFVASYLNRRMNT